MELLANIILDTTAFIIVLLLYFNRKRDRNKDLSQLIFSAMLLCMIFYLCVDMMSWVIEGKYFWGSKNIQITLSTSIYLLQIVLSYLWLIYTDYWINRSIIGIKRRALIYLIPLFVELALLFANLFTGWIFTINDVSRYERGDFFLHGMAIFYCLGIYSLIICAKAFFTAKDKARKAYCLWMSCFMILPATSSIVLIFFIQGISLTAPFYAISLLMIYLYVHKRLLDEEKLKAAYRGEQLQRANIAIMLSQIQPHFLYNALSVIQALCETDPATASVAMNDFAFFLRGNMDSLNMDKPISFEQELAHTKHYLALEKLRFKNAVNIEYDIEVTVFRLPTLTLQPIVENAVRHGITKREGGGTVKISTREVRDAFLISVEDNGIGYDAAQVADDGKKPYRH